MILSTSLPQLLCLVVHINVSLRLANALGSLLHTLIIVHVVWWRLHIEAILIRLFGLLAIAAEPLFIGFFNFSDG